jgi:hypothetical protein
MKMQKIVLRIILENFQITLLKILKEKTHISKKQNKKHATIKNLLKNF